MKERNNVILVPINFSDRSHKGIEIAGDLAERWGASVVFLHVISMPVYDGLQDMQTNYLAEVRKFAESKLEAMKALITNKSVKVDAKVVKGKAIPEILRYASHNNVRLLVLGSKQYESMDEMLEGTSTERILRYADCPVLTVKENYDVTQIKDIVFATDLKPTSTYITNELKKLQEITGATLHLLKVNTKNDWVTDREAERQLNEFNEVHGFNDFKFVNANADSVEEGILNYAQKHEADMIAMSTHTMNKMPVGINRYFITEKIMQGMPKLLWTCVPKDTF
ncbi:MAG: universal stress protein [Fulvivirga sp.]